jgi:hypothetical protein
MTTTWSPLDDGATIGQTGSESGIILRDDEHPLGARITLERGGGTAPYAITCGIYGWMMHTHFSSSEADAQRDYERMREALSSILAGMPDDEAMDYEARKAQSYAAIAQFVERFR